MTTPETPTPDAHVPTFVEYTAGPSAGWAKRWRFDCSCAATAGGFATEVSAAMAHALHVSVTVSAPEAERAYVSIDPGFTQRQLPELMREQARWVKSMPPTAASLLERAATELEEANTIRRLHEEATRNAAAYRTALERIIDAWDEDVDITRELDDVDKTIAEARTLLDGKPMVTPSQPLDLAMFAPTDYYRSKPHKAAADLIEALQRARGEVSE